MKAFRGLIAGLALVLTGVTGCGMGGGDPLVVRIKEIVGSIEVAENETVELRRVETNAGIKLLTRGAALKVPQGARVQIEYLKKKGIFWIHGPAELDLVEARLERGGAGGINDSVSDLHVGWYLAQGVFAGAMEGEPSDRPSIEVQTDDARFIVSDLGKFAVIRDPAKEGGEAWVRDGVGPESPRLQSIKDGAMLEFPRFGLALWNQEDGLSANSIEEGDKSFCNDFLDPLTIRPESFPDLGHLLDEVDWKRMR